MEIRDFEVENGEKIIGVERPAAETGREGGLQCRLLAARLRKPVPANIKKQTSRTFVPT